MFVMPISRQQFQLDGVHRHGIALRFNFHVVSVGLIYHVNTETRFHQQPKFVINLNINFESITSCRVARKYRATSFLGSVSTTCENRARLPIGASHPNTEIICDPYSWMSKSRRDSASNNRGRIMSCQAWTRRVDSVELTKALAVAIYSAICCCKIS